MIAVIVTRANNDQEWKFQQDAGDGKPDAIRKAVLNIRQLHPSLFRDGAGLSAELVELDSRYQVVGTPKPIELTGYLTTQ